MCVIIIKNPGILLPYEKIQSACKVNPDGFGISVYRDNEILTFKNYDPKGNNPDEVFKIIQKNIDHQQYIHLRYSTKGVKNLSNCHPFTVLDKPDCQIQFMHNGTLTAWGTKDDSDTKDFCVQMVNPLLELLYKADGPDILQNPLLTKVMAEMSGNGTFVLYDNRGNHFYAGSTGYTHEGWWSSNEYSFRHDHRTKSTFYANKTYNGGPAWDDFEDTVVQEYLDKGDCWRNNAGDIVRWSSFKNDYDVVASKDQILREAKILADLKEDFGQAAKALPPVKPVVPEVKTTAVVPFRVVLPESLPQNEETRLESKLLGYALSEAKRHKLAWSEHTAPTNRTTFVELAGVADLSELNVFTVEELEAIVLQTPHAATLLIMDLLYVLYRQNLQEEKKVA